MAAALKGAFDVQLCGRGENPAEDAAVVIFAVKPADFSSCIEGLGTDLSGKLVISIMAGISIAKLREKTGAEKIVRSMPNLPLQVGKGFTAWMSGGDSDKDLVRKIFQTFGEEIEVTKEEDLNAVTALSGSGPAYFFYLCELFEKKALAWGFGEKEATKIARATFVGAAGLLEKGELGSAEWRAAVTSKGGTTEAAFRELVQIEGVVDAAFEAAKKRSEELNNQA